MCDVMHAGVPVDSLAGRRVVKTLEHSAKYEMLPACLALVFVGLLIATSVIGS